MTTAPGTRPPSSRRNAVAAGVLAVVMVVAAVLALTLGRSSVKANALLGVPAKGLLAPESAPALPELDATAWINSPALTPASLAGKVVWVDFWDASCINCRRTFPFLGKLASTYAAAGLVVVGVHTPEFDFEKPAAYVERSAEELGVTWPVAVDPERKIWDAFGNQYWPAQYLVDRQGKVRLAHAGEGDDAQLEGDVRALLDEGGSAGGTLVGDVPTTELPGSGGVLQTPERYLGADRSSGTLTAPVPAGTSVVRSDAAPSADHVALGGTFLGAAESVTGSVGSTVTLAFTGRDVYAVLAAAGPGALLDVTLDGQPVPPDRRGPALRPEGGRTVATVPPAGDGGDLLHLLTAPLPSTGSPSASSPAAGTAGPVAAPTGLLTLTVRTAPTAFFTFTFGA